MIAGAVCGGIALMALTGLAAGLWRDYVVQSELEADAAWEAHIAEACDLATDPDLEHFREWSRELAWDD